MVTTVSKILQKSFRRGELIEFIKSRLRDALVGDISITTSPIGTNIIIYCMKPGLVIGTRGRTIKSLQEEVERRFGFENVQISVSEIEVPELNAEVMAQRIAQAIASGVRWRRVSFWALRRIMDAGAVGAEIVISGKLTSARSRSEKFTAGLIPKSGEFAKYVRVGIAHVQLATGIYGVKVKIYPANAPLPEQVNVAEKKEVVEAG
ncbi:MAG: 30S ribosomal protein S3 [Nitrososphaerota archaeon]|nr:30S ribosomal protein S3 [Candidatus Calditenuaceae archaeon]MDW8072951.1 30S ribosomal protein S3 [Nitrososphaerota archaeon]